MIDQFSAPERRSSMAGDYTIGRRLSYVRRRKSIAPVDRRSNKRTVAFSTPQRRTTRLPFGRREGDAARAKAAGQFVPHSYLKAAVTQAIRDFVPSVKPAAPVKVLDRRDPSRRSKPEIDRRDGPRRSYSAGDRRKVRTFGSPVRRIGNGLLGRRAGDKTPYDTLPWAPRESRVGLGGKVPGKEFPAATLGTNFAPPATVNRRYDSEAARDDSRLAKELADTIFVLSTSPMNEGVSRSNLRAALLAVTRRIEEREKNA